MSLVVKTCGFRSFYFLPQISEVGRKNCTKNDNFFVSNYVYIRY